MREAEVEEVEVGTGNPSNNHVSFAIKTWSTKICAIVATCLRNDICVKNINVGTKLRRCQCGSFMSFTRWLEMVCYQGGTKDGGGGFAFGGGGGGGGLFKTVHGCVIWLKLSYGKDWIRFRKQVWLLQLVQVLELRTSPAGRPKKMSQTVCLCPFGSVHG
jgi:hypothetical protein